MRSLYLQMETNVNSVIGDPSLKRLVVTEELLLGKVLFFSMNVW